MLDKSGNFVDGLRQEDFQLKVDGKPQTISFFSRIAAGTAQERSQLAALKAGTKPNSTSPDTEVRGRTVIFFIDDLHLSGSSVNKTRETVTDFIANQMGANDVVAIASASGQIGFLQQFTDNKTVLRAAIDRLHHKPYVVFDTESIKMTEYAALRIEQGDKDALSYYTNEYLKATKFNSPGGGVGPPTSGGAVASSSGQNRSQGGISREIAERQVRERALMMLRQASAITTNTLAGFENLLNTAAQQHGRKLVFFISDGFYLNDRNTGFANKLREVIDKAVRAGVVIYSFDARGLTSSTDSTSNRSDPEGKLARSNIGEISASQDGMNALAGDTGGRALFNSEQLNNGFGRALKETSNYYLLAWRPETEEQKAVSFKKIDISVAGRPELTVRLPKGYLANLPSTATAATETNATKPSADKPADADLKRALSASLAVDHLPTTVSTSYVDAPGSGAIVTAGVQTSALALDYGSDGKQAAVDVAGVILNDQGKVADGFRTRLTVNAVPPQYSSQDLGVVYNYKAKLGPGLYQVRAAVRDDKTGKVGSATQWIEIPDLSSRKLTLSSILLRSLKKGETTGPDAEPRFSVDHHFTRTSQLNFLLFIYNAANNIGANTAPDVTAQVEVFRNGATVVSTPVRKLSMAGISDLARIPYGGQFPLESLPVGRYELQITIKDQLARTSDERIATSCFSD
ncbi:MAG: hypothetical protein DMF69_23290 [Acidobacteria bacterium]|nr:MAG: hypothetical protein DMF69_23290 [Acidobacteriota bacterium]